MFFNISNHPSTKWSAAQLEAAKKLGGEVMDFPFPNVPPMAGEEEITTMARAIVAKLNATENTVAMVRENSPLSFELSRMLGMLGATVVVACSERRTVETFDGEKAVKTAVFEFAQFRKLRI